MIVEPKQANGDSAHRDAVTVVAFSPKGDYFATGGQDNNIVIWKTEDGTVVYPFDAAHGVDDPHQGAITALHFTAQSQLVSASRDNTLRVWNLREKGAYLAYEPIGGRDGAREQTSASVPMADSCCSIKGKTLQVLLSVKDGTPITFIQNNAASAAAFETLAVIKRENPNLLLDRALRSPTAGCNSGKRRSM